MAGDGWASRWGELINSPGAGGGWRGLNDW